MKLISEENYLQHFGIPGMKWGHRKAGLKAWGKEAGKVTKNNLLHPIITGKANRESIKSEKTLGQKARRTMVYQNTKDLKDVNKRIEYILAKNKYEKVSNLPKKRSKPKVWDKESTDMMKEASSLIKQGKYEEGRKLQEKALAKRIKDKGL